MRERGGTPFRQISLATGGTLKLKRVPANHVVLVRLTLDQFIFWPKSPPKRGIWHQKSLKKFLGVTPLDPLSGRGQPPPAPTQHSYTPCAGAQVPRLLRPRCRKPFPQIKIYHYTPAVKYKNDNQCKCKIAFNTSKPSL